MDRIFRYKISPYDFDMIYGGPLFTFHLFPFFSIKRIEIENVLILSFIQNTEYFRCVRAWQHLKIIFWLPFEHRAIPVFQPKWFEICNLSTIKMCTARHCCKVEHEWLWSCKNIIYKNTKLKCHPLPPHLVLTYRKVSSSNASHFVTGLIYNRTQNDNFLDRSSSQLSTTHLKYISTYIERKSSKKSSYFGKIGEKK